MSEKTIPISIKEDPKLAFIPIVSEDFVKKGWMTFIETNLYIQYKMTDAGLEQLHKIIDSLPQDAQIRIQKVIGC